VDSTGLAIDSMCCTSNQILNYGLALGFGLEPGLNLNEMCDKMYNDMILCFDIEYV
jgi:hypothetical protein